MNPRPYETDPNIVTSIVFEMNLDLEAISRTGYSVLDMLSDVGGVEAILVNFFGIMLGFWNYKSLDNYLVSRLYQLSNSVDSQKSFSPPKA